MRIAVYYPWIYVKSGIERIIVELKRRSRHDISIVTHHYDADATYPELKEMDVVELDRVSVNRDYLSVIKAAWKIGRTRLDLRGVDALVVCCEGLGSLINFRNDDVPILNICCTPLRPVYDPAYRARVRERAGIKLPLVLAMERLWDAVDRPAWRRYAHVIAISQEVRRRINEAGLWRADPEVVWPGVPASIIRPSDTFEPMFFLPGRIMWTKNIELGIQAFRRFRAARPDLAAPYRLVIAGMVDAKSQAYLQQLRDLAANEPTIEFAISPSDAEMRRFYETCSATLFTAFNEDFGITPIESMAAGKPVLAVDRGGPREVLVDREVGRLLEPDPQVFADAMADLAADPETMRRWGAAGIRRAPLFTWEHFIDVVDTRLEEIARR